MGPKNSGVATAWSGVAMATLDPPQMAPLYSLPVVCVYELYIYMFLNCILLKKLKARNLETKANDSKFSEIRLIA